MSYKVVIIIKSRAEPTPKFEPEKKTSSKMDRHLASKLVTLKIGCLEFKLIFSLYKLLYDEIPFDNVLIL